MIISKKEESKSIQVNSNKRSVHQKHDKAFKSILENTEEMSLFLNEFLKINIKEEELENQNNTFITMQFQKRECDVLYKIRDKDVFILIEQQTKVDKIMPERLLKYSLLIMEAALRSEKDKTKLRPIIIPIILYTGRNKWDVDTNFFSLQKYNGKYKKYIIRQENELIDTNKYSQEYLLSQDTKLTAMMLLEKCTNSREIRNILVKLLIYAEKKEKVEWLEEIVEYVLVDILGDKKEEIKKVIEWRKNKEMDDEWVETIRRNDELERQKLINSGIKNGIKTGGKNKLHEIIKNMLTLKESDQKIMLYTKAKKSEIEKIRKELQAQNY